MPLNKPRGYFLDESFFGKDRPFNKWGNLASYLIVFLVLILTIWVLRCAYLSLVYQTNLEKVLKTPPYTPGNEIY